MQVWIVISTVKIKTVNKIAKCLQFFLQSLRPQPNNDIIYFDVIFQIKPWALLHCKLRFGLDDIL